MPKFDPAFEKKLLEFEAKKPENRQLRLLDDIASIVQEFLLSFDQQQKDSKATSKQLGALVSDVREQLVELNKKELPDQPDFSKPIVTALEKLGKIDVKPEVKVNVPDVKVPKPEVNVQVDAPQVNVDTTTFEKIVKKDLPKAFELAISKIPKTDIPKVEFGAMEEKLDAMITWLESIDTASRLKPLPGTLKVTNADGTAIGTTPSTNNTISTNQVSVGSTETQIVASRAGREGVLVTNLGTTDVYLGPTGLTTSTGTLLLGTKGTAIFIPTTAAVYGRTASGSQSVSYIEVYNS